MALPELFLPSTLPDFKAAGHQLTPDALYAPVERQAGSSRRRRLFTSVPYSLKAQLEVTQSQLEDFFAWHETSLQAGAVPFTAKVAKVGPGVEYWEAYCLGFSVAHEEGQMRTISLDLRLQGEPSASAPVAPSLTAEFSAVLASLELTEAYPYLLFAEAYAETDFYANTGAALFAEVVASLQTECSGALPYPVLVAEVEAYLNCYAVTGTSAALSAEVSTGLALSVVEDNPLAAEVTTAFAVALQAVGVFSNPATIVVEDSGYPFKGTTRAAVWLYPNGAVYSRVRNYALVLEDLYFTPLTPAAMSGYFVRALLVSGTPADLEPVAGPVYVFGPTNPLVWSVAVRWTSPGTHNVVATIQIANDPDFANIVSSFDVDLTASYI